MYATPYNISWIIFILDLEPSNTDKLLKFRWVKNALLLYLIFLYRYERYFMDSLNHDNQADVIEALNSNFRYLFDLLNIDNLFIVGMVDQIYPPDLPLNKANITDTEAPFLNLQLSTANGFISSEIYDKSDDSGLI